jgi:ribulose-5-phosphate 4-epimerase/fuculose-1-phosphate aldolase
MAVATRVDVQTLKEQVATCCRLMYNEGLFTYSGHVSARIPDTELILIHPLFESRSAVRPEQILTVDLDTKVAEGDALPPDETRIHTEVYRARPEVQAVAHLHSEMAILFTLADVDLVPFKNHAVRWWSGIPVHPDPCRITTEQQGRELAQTLGQHNAALLRAHGSVIVAEDVRTVFVDAVHFEENARAQFNAMQLGRVKPLTEAELEALSTEWTREKHAAKLWHHYVQRATQAGVL